MDRSANRRSGISCALIRNKKPGRNTPHTSYSVLIPQRQPGDILYQYVTAHISSSLASALAATKKLSSFGSGGWAVRVPTEGGHQCAPSPWSGPPMGATWCATLQTPPTGTCSTFSKCFYLLHSYPPSVPVARSSRSRKSVPVVRAACAECPARYIRTNNRIARYCNVICECVLA